MAVDLGWLNYVPGARAAYDWLAPRVERFFADGPLLQQQVNDLDAFWYSLPMPPPGGRTAAQNALLNQWAQVKTDTWNRLEEWKRYEPWVRKLWTAVQSMNVGQLPADLPSSSPQLGAWPAVLVPQMIVAAGVLGAGLLSLFSYLRKRLDLEASHQRVIAKFYEQAVANGLISPVDAAKALQSINLENTSASGGLNTADVLLYGGAALLALLVLSPGRRR